MSIKLGIIDGYIVILTRVIYKNYMDKGKSMTNARKYFCYMTLEYWYYNTNSDCTATKTIKTITFTSTELHLLCKIPGEQCAKQHEEMNVKLSFPYFYTK